MAEKDRENGSYVQPAIPKFDRHYDHWKMLMENLLRSKDYWDVVEKGISELPADANQDAKKAHEDAKLKVLKAKNYLFQAIERGILETMLNIDTAKNIWDSLSQKYQRSTKVKRAQLQALRGEFESLKMKEGETVSEYFARTLTIAKRMRLYGESVSETIAVEKVMRSIRKDYNYVVCSIEQGNNVEKLSVDELQASI